MRAALILALLSAAARAAAPAGPDYGVLLLAHGGDPAWNARIEEVRAGADKTAPTELALGMADPATMQAAVDRLQKRGVSRVVAVPLFVHSRSEVMDQTRYALGLSTAPSEVLRAAEEAMKGLPMPPGMHHMHLFSLTTVKHAVPVALAPALDEDPFVSKVLLERALALSKEPKAEAVVLVAHGPVDDAALPAWESALAVHAKAVKDGGKFRAAATGILRDDAPPPVRAASVAKLRAVVAELAKGGRVLVVPVLIARGGIEDKIPKDLAGLDFAWSGDALLPHAGFDAWVISRAAGAAGGR